MIVSERIGLDSPSIEDLGQDWIGPLISSVTSIGLTVYKGIQERKAEKEAKKQEAAAAAAEAAAAAAMLTAQQPKMLTEDGATVSRSGTTPAAGLPSWAIYAMIGAGALGLGAITIILLKK